MNMFDITTLTGDIVTINPKQVCSIVQYKEDQVLIIMPSVKYFISGKVKTIIDIVIRIG
jgi:hypothetical protein